MKLFSSNAGYFFKEVKTMIRLNLFSNSLTIFSTGLIFFILAMIISGWWVSSHVVNVVQGEAEINVYLDEEILNNNTGVSQMVESIKGIEGVQAARVVDQDEAYNRMVEILGKEASVLNKFDDNPFSSFVELKIDLQEIDPVLEKLTHMMGVEHVRDNREVLERLRNIAEALRVVGILVVAAVGISTLVIISHIIRLGISNNKEQIYTLRLLGAPELFIAFPFLLEGLLLTIGGGILAVSLATFSISYLYAQMAGPLPFIPLPPLKELVSGMGIVVMSLSAVLGFVGSLLGLVSVRNN
ncbi:Cell division protein FtsX [Desulfosporosinus sp. I2]|uniref:cell division protein FtsX n=1 Tax=Desulfosporosinus sp. I2 TaxID=1617025 RepID=UPI0005EEBDBE|nr:permease-like cell division protein FtsX [Desulfosporosinus sp. I2]KJR48256.1 Cell division protein FtsX [Desulfosporosinus sp. I2]